MAKAAERGKSRTIAREWWVSHLTIDDTPLDIKRLAKEAEAELIQDPEFIKEFVQDFLFQSLYDMGQRIMANWRTDLRTTSVLRAQIAEDIKKSEAKWAKWLEYDPRTGANISLVDMSRIQLLDAADRRMEKSNQYRTDAEFFMKIAEGLTGDQRVRDVYSDDQLSALRANIAGDLGEEALESRESQQPGLVA